MADTSIEIDVRRALEQVTSLRDEMAALRGEMKKVSEAGKSTFDVGADGALREARALDQLQREYNDLVQATKTLRTAAAGAWDARAVNGYSRAIAQAEQGLRKMENAASAVGVNLKKANQEATTGKQVFENYFGTLTKATIIVAVLDQVRQLAGQALTLADNYSKAQKSFAAFLGSAERADQVLADLNKTAKDNFLPVESVQQAGKALLAFGESADNLPAVLTRIANISAATGKDFNELTLIYGKARTAGVLYAEDLNQLTEAGIPIIQEFAKQLGVSSGEVKKLASEGKIGFSELELAFANLTREGSAFAGQAQAAASETDKLSASFDEFATTIGGVLKPAADGLKAELRGILDGLTALARSSSFEDFGNNFIQLFERINPIAGRLGQLLRNALGVQTTGESGADLEADIKRQNQLAKQAAEDQEEIFFNAEKKRKELAAGSAEARKREAAARKRAAEQELKERESEQRRLEQLALERLSPGTEAREIAEENLRHQALIREFRKFNLDVSDIERQHVENIYSIRAKYFNQRLEQQRQAEQAELDDLNDFLADREDAFTAQRATQDAGIDLFQAQAERYILELRAMGADEEDIRRAQVQLDLQAQKARLENELEFQENILKITDAGDTERLNAIKQKIELLKQQIGNVTFQISNPETGEEENGGFSLFKILGANTDAEKEKIKAAAQEIVSAIQSIAAANVEAAQAAVDAADQRVRAAEEALDREIELAEAGVASNVSLRQQELLDAQAARERALEDSKRAQRQQLALDTVTQASGIATSVANIIKGWSSVPFVGFLLAAAQVAALFALVSSTRARARAISTQQFRRGGSGYVDENGVIVGASHEAGGVTVPEYEGGEFFTSDGSRFAVVNRKMTAKHFDLLQAVNRDDRAGMAAALRRLTSAPSLRRDISVGAGPSASGSSEGGDGFTPQERKQILRLLAQQNETTKNRPIVTREGNDTVIRQGNHTRRIKNA